MDYPKLVAVVLVAAMCAVSVYGAFRIPHDARWPARFGGLGFQTTLGRGTGLVMWPLLGGIIASTAWMEEGKFEGLAMAGLLLMLWGQWTAVERMTRQ